MITTAHTIWLASAVNVSHLAYLGYAVPTPNVGHPIIGPFAPVQPNTLVIRINNAYCVSNHSFRFKLEWGLRNFNSQRPMIIARETKNVLSETFAKINVVKLAADWIPTVDSKKLALIGCVKIHAAFSELVDIMPSANRWIMIELVFVRLDLLANLVANVLRVSCLKLIVQYFACKTLTFRSSRATNLFCRFRLPERTNLPERQLHT